MVHAGLVPDAVLVFEVRSKQRLLPPVTVEVNLDVCPQSMQVIVTGECTTAGGALADAVECIITVQDSDTSGSGFASFKTFTASLVVDANNGAHQYSVMLPVKLLAANQFVLATVIVQMAAGATGTLSNATAGCELQVGGFSLNAPQPEYSTAGYFEFLV